MNEVANSNSPLQAFFDESISEIKIFQSCEVSALKKPIKAKEDDSYIFDLSCIKKIAVVGKEARIVVEKYFEISPINLFQWTSVGSGGLICLAKDKIVLVNSYDGSLIDGFTNAIPSDPKKHIVQRADYSEIALSGPLASVILEELVPVPSSAWSQTGLLCSSLAGANVILRKVNNQPNHLRCIIQPADTHYVLKAMMEINRELNGHLGCIFSYINTFQP